MATFTLQCDGASRGNPGPSGAGAVLYDETHVEVWGIGKRLPPGTNNEAEYEAVILGLERACGDGVRRVSLRADSQVLVRQLKREYKVRAANLRPRYERVVALLARLEWHDVECIPREQNTRADALANEAIDRG